MLERSKVLVREARESDLKALEWEGRYQHFRRLYRRAMTEAQRGRRILLVAEVDGRIVGQIFIQLASGRAELADGERSGYLYAFRVRPSFRGQGIGSQLLEAAEQALRVRAFERAVIAVAQDNQAALRLYENHDYRRFAEDPGEWSYIDHRGRLQRVSEPAFILEKRL
jgi:ribosomal protein S18 acetylase RimI-like enzyme